MFVLLFGVTFADSERMAAPPLKREYLSMKVLPELVRALEVLATEQNRSRSNAVEQILIEWFQKNRPELLRPSITDAP